MFQECNTENQRLLSRQHSPKPQISVFVGATPLQLTAKNTLYIISFWKIKKIKFGSGSVSYVHITSTTFPYLSPSSNIQAQFVTNRSVTPTIIF